ncbi:bifunctional ADP-dependent NAD(P)H-hydrate dehydratase/NAD(P)H-hydrate epimerase [Candidatus Pantoea edessiphila]|uniref:bifunctional ADP-dependent NAD(P)H-hydrate dehydratase/NAD(P)H-hydrate epimerase n=1 Tax=Candidatus Pantoea edessiphila TaxID=2044610 RepID=UPI003B217910
MVEKNRLPYSVWPIKSLNKLEVDAACYLNISLYEIMLRAGNAICNHISKYWPDAINWLFLCGHGNNGGDGYVAARIAKISGKKVTLISYSNEIKDLSREAQIAYNEWISIGGKIHEVDAKWPDKIDIIIDALLGTGINRVPNSAYSSLIKKANLHSAPILSVDIPSGLFASNGNVLGNAIYASHTLSFITLKPGQLIGKARDFIGELHYIDLGLSSFFLNKKAPILRFDSSCLSYWLKPRRPTSHKGDYGKLLFIGGNIGTAGAIFMAAEAALRTGAGLVKLLTYKENIAPIVGTRPEIMIDDIKNEYVLKESLLWADIIIIGPGLGNNNLAKDILNKVSLSKKPMIWDADALNFLSTTKDKCCNRIITPHSGEASRLLNCSLDEIEKDRLYTARCLSNQYGGIVVLKGAGTIIVEEGKIAIADVGNAGMASGGMGDILTGIIAALVGQQLTLFDAACAGCIVHGTAADELASNRGLRGILATDLFKILWKFINPDIKKI